MNPIRDWLSSDRNYVEGVRLYLEFGQDKDLKRLLTVEAETPFKRSKLEKALREVLQGRELPTPEEKESPARVSQKSWPADAAPDDVLKALRSEFLTHFKRMQDLRSQLLLIPTVEERGEAAFEILRLDALCDEIFDQRDHYLAHGKLPSEPEVDSEIVVEPKRAYQRMDTLKRYIRRETRNLARKPGNSAAAARRMKWIKEFNTYAKKFGEETLDAV